MATHFHILAWRIPWTEETVRLQFMELQRVGDSVATQQGHVQMLRLKRWNVLLGHMRAASHSLVREQDLLKNVRIGIRKEAGNMGVR